MGMCTVLPFPFPLRDGRLDLTAAIQALVLLLLLSDLSSESRFAICSLLLLIAVLASRMHSDSHGFSRAGKLRNNEDVHFRSFLQIGIGPGPLGVQALWFST